MTLIMIMMMMLIMIMIIIMMLPLWKACLLGTARIMRKVMDS